MYTIKDVAKKTGLTPYTIRYYAKEGLLPTIGRNEHGVRQFKEADLEAIYIIECLKNCGMQIKEIKEFTEWTLEGDVTIGKRLEMFREKYGILQQKMKQMQETLEALKYKVWFCKQLTTKDESFVRTNVRTFMRLYSVRHYAYRHTFVLKRNVRVIFGNAEE